MRYHRYHLGRPAPLRAPLVILAAFALITACQQDDPLPTAPRLALPVAPLAAVLGADVTYLPFDGVAINEAGQVVGSQGSLQAARAMLWTPGGAVQDIGTLGGASSWAYAINNAGQVAGASITAAGDKHAFLWTPGEGMRDLGTFGGGRTSIARGINDRGEVVGEVTVLPAEPLFIAAHRAFRWTPALGMQDLGDLGGGLTSSIAFDINNAGQVVGRGYPTDRVVLPPTDPEYYSHAFLWTPGQGMRDLGGGGIALAINDAGTVVGRVVYGHGFRWTQAEGMRNLGAFGPRGDSSMAYGINEAGQIVGSSTVGVDPYSGMHAFIWTESQGLESLSPATGMSRARAINNRQQVVGNYRVATVHLAPGNVPPVSKPGGPYTGTEGSAVVFDMSGIDPDGGELSGTILLGDGSKDFIDVMVPWAWRTQKHVYADNGTYTLTLIVSDIRGGRDTATTTVTIDNIAPRIVAGSLTGPTAPIQLTGGSASAPISFQFTDPAARKDIYAAEIACGNGVVLTPSNMPVGEFTGLGAQAATCPYVNAGVYTVGVSVSDEDGGTSAPEYYRYVIVYDPAGAFTTGSGFYSADGQGKAKAHFTFTVKYLRDGSGVPNGTAKFWIPGAHMDFESTAIEMLVASGNRGQFWGTGLLNGEAARFRITAVDGGATGHDGMSDAIRIELWNASGTTLLYDSQPDAARDAAVATSIDGGNIQIHRERAP
jgi:probable HAF family extracellular repeat protein